jgi:hypothetical protein
MDIRDILLDPTLWSYDISKAWHRAIPNLGKAFEALRGFAADTPPTPIDTIISARDALLDAREDYNCRCSGFTLQYEGSCQCGAGNALKEAEAAFWDVIRAL